MTRIPIFKPKTFFLKRRKLLKGILAGVGGFLLFIIVLFAWFAKDLPTPKKIAELRAAESTKISDREGKLLYETGQKKRTLIDAKDIPENIKQATIAIEDKNFYKHQGISFRGIARALFVNIFTGKTLQGGSSITQQYVKNALLSPERTLGRKIKELILAIEIEQLKSKDEILTLYLNEIPYGSNLYGIEEASKAYFGKSASDLNLSEATTLAALPQRPSYYSPYGTHTNELFKRKNHILDEMVKLDYITEKEAETAQAVPPNSKNPNFQKRTDSILAPHFVMYVREILAEEYGERIVDEGGLRVTTTLDFSLQEKAEKAIEANLKNLAHRQASNAAIVSLDPKTGEILAMVGSKDYFDQEIDGNVNVTIANRQPGSAFKPVAYATAFKDSSYYPAFPLFDVPTDFGGGYKPQNYDGINRGHVTVRQALANSLNVPSVKILALAGLSNTLKTAQDLGITTLIDPQRYGLSLVLGGGEVKLLELTSAFGVFANQGQRVDTQTILKVEDRRGRVLFEKEEPVPKEVLSPQIAYEIAHILSDNAARAPTFGDALSFGARQVAVKTGTTQEYRDGWTIGFTPSIAVGVWAGNNDNSPMRPGSAGVVVAGPIFRHFMTSALAGKPIEQLEQPLGITTLTVDKLSGKLPTENSPETVTDIFADWQIPTDWDDIHTKIKINKLNGKKATDLTPSDLIEERVYVQIHSERPDNPNWEGPVLAWARAAGLEPAPTLEDDDMYNQQKVPHVAITRPKQHGQTFSKNQELVVEASVDAPYGIRTMEYLIDEIIVDSPPKPHIEFRYSVSNLSSGEHTAIVKVIDQNGAVAEDIRRFRVE